MTDVLSREAMEEYLRNNPHFVRDWVMKNVSKAEWEEWLDGDVVPPMPENNFSHVNKSQRNSITTNMFRDIVEGKRKYRSTYNSRSKEELLKMTQMEVFMELIRDITNELDVNVLCHKILLNVNILTHSDRGSLFLVRGRGEIKYLVSKLFDVRENSTLQQSLHDEGNEIRVPFGVGIAGAVAKTKTPINIKNAYEDSRFNKEVDKKTGFRTQSILCMPILNYEGEVIGIAQIMNKTDGSSEFTKQDEEVFKNYLSFCGIGLANAQLFEMSVHEYKRNQLLLRLAQNIFEVQSSLDDLVQKIMLDAQDMLKAERCSIYLIAEDCISGADFLERGPLSGLHEDFIRRQVLMRQDPEVFNKHHDVLKALRNEPKCIITLKEADIVFSKAFELHADRHGDIITPVLSELLKCTNAQVARKVAATGMLDNIIDSTTDPEYEKEIVYYDGFKIRNLLSVPIKNSQGNVIGVVQLMNKLNGKPFDENDINNLQAFAIFCGLGVHNCQTYESVCKLMAKQQVALEVLSYHAGAPPEETQKLVKSEIPSGEEYGLYTYEFDDFPLNDDDTCKATVRMFMDVGVLEEFQVPRDVLSRWILSVKKNYRPVTYHNWRHAFNVAQSMFTIIYTGEMSKLMTNLEIFGLLVACLCHDLDHRGTNNAFQSKSDSPLALLYGTSTMEHHHFDQCIMILNSEGNNIFGNLSQSDYRNIIKLVETAILSTDLALYFRKKGVFQDLVDKGNKDWVSPDNKELLRGMMMTACDVAAITKPWEIQKRVAHLVADEFFEQGDIERSRLQLEPIAMMDRKKRDELPKMQVGFIDAICLPLYKLMASMDSGMDPWLTGCTKNRENWNELAILESSRQDSESAASDKKSSKKGDWTKSSRVKPTEEGQKGQKEAKRRGMSDSCINCQCF